MNLNLQYEPVKQSHVHAATQLVLTAYQEERQNLPFLPPADDFTELFANYISKLFARGTGLAALSNGRLMGFLAGLKVDEFFGQYPGVYMPLLGHGASKEERSSIYQGLYTKAAELWVRDGYVSHALTLFAHDQESVNTWFWQGFGMRCVDSIRKTEPVDARSTAVTVRKLAPKDISTELVEVHRQHCQHYNQAPIFMPRSEEDPGRDMREWLEQDNVHLWAAYKDKSPTGYMKIAAEGETVISRHPQIMNVTAAYVSSDARESGTGAALLANIQEWLKNNDYPLCGVDFEAINTVGARFGNRHFTPYTYSLGRRIDERVL